MGELDDKLVEKMNDENIEHTDFRIFRDDSWDILINADRDLPRFEELLESLHPSIKWTVVVSKEENNHALEYLDLTIMLINGRIETDFFFSQVQKATGNPRSLFQKDTYVTIGIAYILN